MEKVEKYYLYVDKEGMGFSRQIREKMKELFKISSAELRSSGGRSEDLHEEIAEWTSFLAGHDERFELYTVTDSNVNGYAECISVLCSFPKNSERSKSALSFLEELKEAGFVSSRKSFAKRPHGWKSFFGYLEGFYCHPAVKPFLTKDGEGE